MDAGFSAFLLLLALTPLWIMVLQACFIRLGMSRVSGQVTAMLASGGALLPVGAALWLVYLANLKGQELWSSALYAALTYALLAYSYFHVFNMGETARRVRVLVELREHENLSVEELKSFYNTGAMLDRRIERLIALGQVSLEDGRMVLRSKRLYRVAWAMDWWVRVLSLPPLKSSHDKGRTLK